VNVNETETEAEETEAPFPHSLSSIAHLWGPAIPFYAPPFCVMCGHNRRTIDI